MNRHIIRQQEVHLKLESGKQAFSLQEKMSRFFKTHLQRRLEELFDELVDEHHLIKIDRLEIDLGQMSEEELFKPENLDKWLSNIKKAIIPFLENENSDSKLTLPEAQFKQWLYFLEYGTLSWQGLDQNRNWEADILQTLATQQIAVHNLRELLQRSGIAFTRLLLQFSAKFLLNLANSISAVNHKNLLVFLAEWQEMGSHISNFETERKIYLSSSNRQGEIVFWANILHKIILKNNRESSEKLIVEFLMENLKAEELVNLNSQISHRKKSFPFILEILKADPLSKQTEKLISEKNRSLSEVDENFKLEQTYSNSLEEKPSEKKKKSLSKTDSIQDSSSKMNNELPKDDLMNQEEEAHSKHRKSFLEEHSENSLNHTPEKSHKNLNEKPSKTQKQKPNDDEIASYTRMQWADTNVKLEIKDGQFWYVENAGIVMIQPFLKPLFTQLGWVEENEFVDDLSRQKSVCMTHFLATGEKNPPEYNLILPKVLCGLPMNTLIDRQIALSESEIEEAEGLLEIIINHWGALGNVSSDSLREGFLRRSGKLTKSSESWLLQVERQTMDLLLDRLPWGFNIIKYPWMKEILNVEWG